MLPPRLDPRSLTVFVASLAVVACAAHGAPDARSTPPRGELLVSSADSTFWISTAAGRVDTRAAPLMLARYNGRFYELFTADDDFSYEDALLLGERLYQRDLLTGDSTVVFTDTAVARVASAYARAHPDERPLDPDEDGADDPATQATAEVDVLGVFGPYVSYEYHFDVAQPGRAPWHSTRRGVLDLRSGKQTTVSDLFGSPAAERVEALGRRVYETERDSAVRARAMLSGRDRRAAAALSRLRFDEHSFILSDVGGKPAVSFGVPAEGEGSVGVLALDPLQPDSVPPAWWRDVRAGVPTTDEQGNDRWQGAGYQLIARYDTSGETARLSIADSAKREWPLITIMAPVHRVDWLDRPAVSAADRRALTRAFDDAASYGEPARVAAAPAATILSLVTRSGTSHASVQARRRQPARNLRAHDARAREQPGARVRRRDSFDDGQVRRDRRASSHAYVGGDGVDRPRGLSRAHSSGRSGGHAGERELRWENVDGSGCARRGGRLGDGQTPSHQLVLPDVRCG